MTSCSGLRKHCHLWAVTVFLSVWITIISLTLNQSRTLYLESWELLKFIILSKTCSNFWHEREKKVSAIHSTKDIQNIVCNAFFNFYTRTTKGHKVDLNFLLLLGNLLSFSIVFSIADCAFSNNKNVHALWTPFTAAKSLSKKYTLWIQFWPYSFMHRFVCKYKLHYIT